MLSRYRLNRAGIRVMETRSEEVVALCFEELAPDTREGIKFRKCLTRVKVVRQ